jgi:predicted transcriptional regulator
MLLSIRPRFAELILNGEKTVELRRVRPDLQEGDLVLLYASSPIRELIGTCTAAGLDVGSASALWKLHGKSAGVTRSEYNAYFAGAAHAVGISIKDPRRVLQPRTLAELRARLPGFVPPQSFSYLSAEELKDLDIKLEPLPRRCLWPTRLNVR